MCVCVIEILWRPELQEKKRHNDYQSAKRRFDVFGLKFMSCDLTLSTQHDFKVFGSALCSYCGSFSKRRKNGMDLLSDGATAISWVNQKGYQGQKVPKRSWEGEVRKLPFSKFFQCLMRKTAPSIIQFMQFSWGSLVLNYCEYYRLN